MIAYKLQLKIIVMPLITVIVMISGAVSGGPGLPGMGWKEAALSRESGQVTVRTGLEYAFIMKTLVCRSQAVRVSAQTTADLAFDCSGRWSSISSDKELGLIALSRGRESSAKA